MHEGGRVGRKAGQGFYRYAHGQMIDPPVPQLVPAVEGWPPVWIGTESAADAERLRTLVASLGATVESGDTPSPAALCLLAPYGRDATGAALLWQANPARSRGDHSIAEADLAISRRANFWILPVEVLGSTQNSMNLGTL